MTTVDPSHWSVRAGKWFTSKDAAPLQQDRLWLWRLKTYLELYERPDSTPILADLLQYLDESCTHEWVSYPAEPVIPDHRQCVWCKIVELDEAWIAANWPAAMVVDCDD